MPLPFVLFRSCRRVVVVGALLLTAGKSALAQAMLDLSKPDDIVTVNRRIQCSAKDATPATFSWRGGVLSRVPGEQDRHILNVEGMNVRQCVTVNHPTRGRGYRMVSREILLFLDPQTNQVLRTWKNPWTGETNEVMQVANDPVNQQPSFPRNADGTPTTWTGTSVRGRVWQSIEVPLFYNNPLGGDYQEWVGGQYQAVEAFDFFIDEKDLLNSARDPQTVTIAWSRISQWLPWMRMGDRPGMLVFTTVGKKLNTMASLPAVMQNEIKTNYPSYTSPPPVDDARPNETSWTAFKKETERRKAAGAVAVSTSTTVTPAVNKGTPAAGMGRYDVNNPEHALKIEQRLSCSLTDGKPAFYWFPGKVYSRVPGERDRLLFKVHGWSARACKTFNDPVRGYGYRAVNRELLIYEDATTGEILRTWKNPWSGEAVPVMHVANDPVSARVPTFAKDSTGKLLESSFRGFFFEGFHFTGGTAARLFYKNPLGGEYQENVGGWYHSMEYGSNHTPVDEMLDMSKKEVGRNITWMRTSKWLPWMKQGDRAGVIYYHTAGTRVESVDDLPLAVRTEIRKNYAAWLTAPPLDDTRPNMTSWDQFKRLMDSTRKSSGGRP